MAHFLLNAMEFTLLIYKKQCVMEETYNFVRELAMQGGTLLFVGTKKQAQETVREEAERCSMFYVNNRWLGGTLTNYQTIRKRIQYLQKLEEMEEDGTFTVLPKKEVMKLQAEKKNSTGSWAALKICRGFRTLSMVDPRKEKKQWRRPENLAYLL